jgi:predicted RNase H-like HicB family nuclease
MIREYVQAAMEKAQYEIIDDPERYYGEIPGCRGVWATGRTLEECRRNLEDVLDGWLVVRLQKRLSIPPIEGQVIQPLEVLPTHAEA